MQNPFSWDYLTAPLSETPTWGPLSIAYVAIFGLGFLIAFTMYNDVGNRMRGKRLLYKTIRRGTSIAMAIFGIGLFFFLFRFLHVEFLTLHMRIWLYLSALAAAIMLGYYWYYIRTIYPKKVKEDEQARIKKKYLAPVNRRSGGSKSRQKRYDRKSQHV